MVERLCFKLWVVGSNPGKILILSSQATTEFKIKSIFKYYIKYRLQWIIFLFSFDKHTRMGDNKFI